MMFKAGNIKNEIKKIHSNDERQLGVIFDESKSIIVEAPAGCGKTKTMISKIAYILSTKTMQSTKKILALTFSVNAAYKIKKDIFDQLPMITNCAPEESMYVANKIYVANYHSFSRRLLKLYGKSIINNDRGKELNFDKLVPIDDADEKSLHLKYKVKIEIARFLSDFNKAIKEYNIGFIDDNWDKYNKAVKENLIPNNYITYNAIILLAYELFIKFPGLKRFYNSYFPIVFVDEFQDTNYIAWKFLKEIICNETRIVFMGDPLQRIYGFIGAVPNLMVLAEEEYNMKRYELTTNYRFKDNKEMLLLDKNIRSNAQKLNNESISESANPYIVVAPNQEEESKWICKKIKELRERDENVAVLVRTGASNKNTQYIINKLHESDISYFFALFTDNDPEYDKFHETCLIEFNKLISEKMVITSKILDGFVNNVKKYYGSHLNETIISLIKLLEVFIKRIPEEYNYLENEELISFIQDTFINKGLKQNMDKINEGIILATIHAFKGLEYPHIILADNEQYSFPTFPGACKYCNQNKNIDCIKKSINADRGKYYEELSVFYVGFTRATKKVYFTLSNIRLKANGEESHAHSSCFLKLKGISYENLVIL